MKNLALGVAVLVLAGCSNGNNARPDSGSNAASTPQENNVASQPLQSIDAIKAAISAPVANQIASAASTPATSEPKSNWLYDQSHDDMRNQNTDIAVIPSDNKINFDAPYDGESNLIISLAKYADQEPRVVFSTSNRGQFYCASVDNECYASAKFDNGEIVNFKVSEASSDINALYITNQEDVDAFIRLLKTSNKLIIELPFFENGRKQFKFTLPGLKWDSVPVDDTSTNNQQDDSPSPQDDAASTSQDSTSPPIDSAPASTPTQTTPSSNTSTPATSDVGLSDSAAKQIMN